MAGKDDNVPVIGDWLHPISSPRTLLSEFIAKEYGSKMLWDDSLEKMNGRSIAETSEPGVVHSKNRDFEPGVGVSKELSINSSHVPKSAARGGCLSERVAGRAGFGGLTLDTSQVRKTASFSSSTGISSPLLTIPPGFSPTIFLDSPIFVSSFLTELSPTTGKFVFPSPTACSIGFPSPTTGKISFIECDNVTAAVTRENADDSIEDADPAASFSFKLPLGYFSCAGNEPTLINHPEQPNLQTRHSEQSEEKVSGDNLLEKETLNSNVNSDNFRPPDDHQIGTVDPKGEYSSAALGTLAEDGYNWRKYGQKQVKGSEFPRSYYKCTHPNCQVKKTVERSLQDHITEIIYKGIHNHSKSSIICRSSISSSHPGNGSQKDALEQNDWKQDDTGANQCTSVPIEQKEQFYPVQSYDGSYRETPEGIDTSSLLSYDGEEDELVTHGSVSFGVDGDVDETESKRRKLDACALEMSTASRAVREPRVVVQTTSEIDILDDGYRWRKYGQKVVKGNSNPRANHMLKITLIATLSITSQHMDIEGSLLRKANDFWCRSYYKCTNPGCTVRKHVERASHDLKSVITTYEGKHNHEVPAARANNHASSSSISASTCLIPRPMEAARMTDSLGKFGMPGRELHLDAAIPNFSVPVSQQTGLNANFAFPSYLSQQYLGDAGILVSNVVHRDERVANSGQQVSRMPLGPQL